MFPNPFDRNWVESLAYFTEGNLDRETIFFEKKVFKFYFLLAFRFWRVSSLSVFVTIPLWEYFSFFFFFFFFCISLCRKKNLIPGSKSICQYSGFEASLQGRHIGKCSAPAQLAQSVVISKLVNRSVSTKCSIKRRRPEYMVLSSDDRKGGESGRSRITKSEQRIPYKKGRGYSSSSCKWEHLVITWILVLPPYPLCATTIKVTNSTTLMDNSAKF